MNQKELISNQMVVPAFCRGRGVLAVVVLGQAVAILLAFAPDRSGDPWLQLGVISLFVHWICLLSVAVLCMIGPRLTSLSPLAQSAVVLVVVLVFTTVVSYAALWFLALYGWFPSSGTIGFLAGNILIALLVGLLAIQFNLMHIERSVRLAAQSQAELEALHARIRPHFLFNSLNTTAELIHQDPDAAEQTLVNLAALFRAAMQIDGLATIADELALGRQYLALEQWRLGQRLTVQWQVQQPLPRLMLPILTVQPLLENAIHHGIEPAPAGGDIQIELTQSSDSLTLCISNSLPAKLSSRQGNGIALRNIHQRLAIHFQQHAKLSFERTAERFVVKLQLPCVSADE